MAEHIAHEVMRAAGIEAAQSSLVEADERLFLAIDRFDRTKRGRRGVVSLEALDAELAGHLDRGDWKGAVQALAETGMIDPALIEPVTWLSAFGSLRGLQSWDSPKTVSMRPDGKARGGRMLKHATDEQRSQPGCTRRRIGRIIYLMFNEGYSASSGAQRLRADPCDEAIRLARLLGELLPHPETDGLLALLARPLSF